MKQTEKRPQNRGSFGKKADSTQNYYRAARQAQIQAQQAQYQFYSDCDEERSRRDRGAVNRQRS